MTTMTRQDYGFQTSLQGVNTIAANAARISSTNKAYNKEKIVSSEMNDGRAPARPPKNASASNTSGAKMKKTTNSNALPRQPDDFSGSPRAPSSTIPVRAQSVERLLSGFDEQGSVSSFNPDQQTPLILNNSEISKEVNSTKPAYSFSPQARGVLKEAAAASNLNSTSKQDQHAVDDSIGQSASTSARPSAAGSSTNYKNGREVPSVVIKNRSSNTHNSNTAEMDNYSTSCPPDTDYDNLLYPGGLQPKSTDTIHSSIGGGGALGQSQSIVGVNGKGAATSVKFESGASSQPLFTIKKGGSTSPDNANGASPPDPSNSKQDTVHKAATSPNMGNAATASADQDLNTKDQPSPKGENATKDKESTTENKKEKRRTSQLMQGQEGPHAEAREALAEPTKRLGRLVETGFLTRREMQFILKKLEHSVFQDMARTVYKNL